ncbi:Flp family type IVb pilin [Clostridium sp. AM58-1XD]|uniref:Flp family type IVb pilin n=1 Tax=Clostridium sp. AM58-1XD TaxID=2292307 RepID=UPI000E4A518C|nr:Flp family type IVb pilin [Clostridium sp. AM58-1XD]RGY97970.1 Flp family type IVb pilin [Clostridium sp. AM58-1XD]
MDVIKWIRYEESGQSMVEYALIMIIVSVAAVSALRVIGTIATGYFELAADKF